MKKNVILPFEDHPYSQMYHHIAFPMGIIQGNAKEDITPWLCGKYINCSFSKNKRDVFTVYNSDNWATKDNILLQQQFFLYPDLFDQLFGDETTCLKTMIGKGFYPYGLYNEEYIPGKWSYQKQYYAHDFLLIGYDDCTNEFVSVSYLRDGKFQRHTIPYENMGMALKTVKQEKKQFKFVKYNPNASFKFDRTRTVSELADYLQSTTSMQTNFDGTVWGMDALRAVTKFFRDSSESGDSIDSRFTRGIMEHKFYMNLRMDYLFKNDILKDFSYVDQAHQVYKMAENVHMLGLKYNLTHNQMVVSNIEKTVSEMLVMESAYLPYVLSDLKAEGGITH